MRGSGVRKPYKTSTFTRSKLEAIVWLCGSPLSLNSYFVTVFVIHVTTDVLANRFSEVSSRGPQQLVHVLINYKSSPLLEQLIQYNIPYTIIQVRMNIHLDVTLLPVDSLSGCMCSFHRGNVSLPSVVNYEQPYW